MEKLFIFLLFFFFSELFLLFLGNTVNISLLQAHKISFKSIEFKGKLTLVIHFEGAHPQKVRNHFIIMTLHLLVFAYNALYASNKKSMFFH